MERARSTGIKVVISMPAGTEGIRGIVIKSICCCVVANAAGSNEREPCVDRHIAYLHLFAERGGTQVSGMGTRMGNPAFELAVEFANKWAVGEGQEKRQSPCASVKLKATGAAAPRSFR